MSACDCLVCGGTLGPARLPGLLGCGDCGFKTAAAGLEAGQLERLYGERYFLGEEYADYLAERRIIEKNFLRRLATLLPYVREPKASRLLEIGCAYGFFLSLACDVFSRVEGIDISKPAIDYATRAGLTVRCGDFLVEEVRGPIDVACLWDTIEHLARPDLYVAKLATLMGRGGVVAITTGDIDSLLARLRGRRWRQIHPPTHLHYFSRRTLQLLLERHGFSLRYVGYDGNYRSLDMIAYITLVNRQGCPRAYAALKRLGLLNWDLYINLRDIVYVIAEKQE